MTVTNPDGGSSTATGAFTVGTDQPPVVSFLSPLAGAAVTGSVVVTAAASDDHAVSRVDFYLDGVLRVSDTTYPYSWVWDTTSTASGPHVLAAKAVDGGSRQTTTSVTVFIRRLGLAISDVTVLEGSSGTTKARLEVTLSEAPVDTVTVEYATVDGTATAGTDYDTASGTVTFTVGSTLQYVDVWVRGDKAYESSETFTVELRNPVGAAIDDGSGVVTIVDEEGGFFTLAPCRLFDSRQAGDGPALVARVVRVVDAVGRCGVPAGAGALSLNVTVTGSTANGNVVLFGGEPTPTASTINYLAGLTRANNAIVPLGGSQIRVRPNQAPGSSVHVIIDVNGYFE